MVTLERPGSGLVREALRLHQRYQCEVVERFSACPWARPARLSGRGRAYVVDEAGAHAESLRPIVGAWADDHGVDVAFVIAPRFDAAFEVFAQWAEEVGALRSEEFLSASFHPDFAPEAGTVRFLRRTPDPTVQLVRRSKLDEIRAADPPHYQDIFKLDLRILDAKNRPPRTVGASVLAHNERLVAEQRGVLERVLADIHRDRYETYERLRAPAQRRDK